MYLLVWHFVWCRDATSDDVYLWDLEHLGKYFKSEGTGIENKMFALAREKTGDRAADIEAEHRAKYNKLIGKFFWDKCLFQDTHIQFINTY